MEALFTNLFDFEGFWQDGHERTNGAQLFGPRARRIWSHKRIKAEFS
jgi:hypothetical protein